MNREKRLKIIEEMYNAAKAEGHKLDIMMLLERLHPGITREIKEHDRQAKKNRLIDADEFFYSKKERIQNNFKGKLQNLLEENSVMIDFSSENYILTFESLPYGCISYSDHILIDDTLELYMEHVKINGKAPYEKIYTLEKEYKFDNCIDDLKEVLYILLKDELPSKSKVEINSTQYYYPVYGEPYSIGGGCSYGPQFARDVISKHYTITITIKITYPNS